MVTEQRLSGWARTELHARTIHDCQRRARDRLTFWENVPPDIDHRPAPTSIDRCQCRWRDHRRASGQRAVGALGPRRELLQPPRCCRHSVVVVNNCGWPLYSVACPPRGLLSSARVDEWRKCDERTRAITHANLPPLICAPAALRPRERTLWSNAYTSEAPVTVCTSLQQ